jgi:hypothetical protein
METAGAQVCDCKDHVPSPTCARVRIFDAAVCGNAKHPHNLNSLERRLQATEERKQQQLQRTQ